MGLEHCWGELWERGLQGRWGHLTAVLSEATLALLKPVSDHVSPQIRCLHTGKILPSSSRPPLLVPANILNLRALTCSLHTQIPLVEMQELG